MVVAASRPWLAGALLIRRSPVRLSLLSVIVVASVLSFPLQHEAAAAPGAPHPTSLPADGPIENVYYYHGRHYPYYYHRHYEVDPVVRTTGAGFSVGGEAAPSFENHRIRTSCDCCCGCGYVGNAAALSKRSVISTAISPNAPVTPSRQTAIGVRFASA